MSRLPKATRRQFLVASTLISTSVGLKAQSISPGSKPARNQASEELEPVPVITAVSGPAFLHAGPLLGHVTDCTARLWAKGSNHGSSAFKIGLQPDLSDGRLIDARAMVEDSSFTGQVQVDGLTAATRYFCAPVIDGTPAMARPFPSFLTAPAAEYRGPLRVAFGSCVGRRGHHAAASGRR